MLYRNIYLNPEGLQRLGGTYSRREALGCEAKRYKGLGYRWIAIVRIKSKRAIYQ